MSAIPNFQELIEKAKEMQKMMQQAQGEITAVQVVGESGGGLVKITINGAHQALGVKISPTLLGEDEDMIEDLVMAAINDAARKIETLTKEKMLKMAKDMKLPEDLGDAGGTGSTGTTGSAGSIGGSGG